MEIQSQEIDKIIEALSKAQGAIDVAVYDATNPHFKNKYATYEALRKVCLTPLSSNGLSITHHLLIEENKRVMVTQLSHVSGQWMRSFLYLPQEKETPQGIGSSITYAKRYSLGALLALSSDEDDDAEASETPYRKPQEAPKPISRPQEGVYLFPFGKHQGKPLNEVPDDYIDYLKSVGSFDKPQAQDLVNELKKAGRL
jgi:hypothetical protein